MPWFAFPPNQVLWYLLMPLLQETSALQFLLSHTSPLSRSVPVRASAVAEAPDAVETPLEKTGPAFEPLKDIEAIQEILPHRYVFGKQTAFGRAA